MPTILKFALTALLTGAVILPGCGKLGGEFGFKAPFDDSFRKATRTPEIRTGERKDWVFVFNRVSGHHDIGVFIMKKEIVWAEVQHYIQKVSEGDKVVRGSIENLDEGRYKIVLVEKKNLIAEQEFSVYSDEESQ